MGKLRAKMEEPVPGRVMGSFAGRGSAYGTGGNGAHRSSLLHGWGMPQPWEEQAACQDTPIELWFGIERDPGIKKSFRTQEQSAQAKAICASCPVLDECRSWALESRIPFGIVGGLTERERQVLIHGHATTSYLTRNRRSTPSRPRQPRPPRACVICDATFLPRAGNQLCCSNSCSAKQKWRAKKLRQNNHKAG